MSDADRPTISKKEIDSTHFTISSSASVGYTFICRRAPGSHRIDGHLIGGFDYCPHCGGRLYEDETDQP